MPSPVPGQPSAPWGIEALCEHRTVCPRAPAPPALARASKGDCRRRTHPRGSDCSAPARARTWALWDPGGVCHCGGQWGVESSPGRTCHGPSSRRSFIHSFIHHSSFYSFKVTESLADYFLLCKP